ncbi:gamma-glutamyltransferase [Sulfitobacter sp. M57]|uniref:gamma-glutamyltransferase n=1 Tax=unclassified Sulfitobacter TaxID=196795 RepID=UPI0023E31E3D|nr:MULTISPECIES: gamma-glutamyltransferase [unclassified Sulfitobacter]MDF3415825.1 gamma-glutamyltransferase [Sulfitobacter sp. KE5]MDF3423305.1 gamma-glutamyltransferase [Sulfitobacter sp. KE43]MDF3434371.1 gamma-glutamyltransferase [Sulfitobacter sp. KE42]MDF3460011.1 gamma-glutamyltransferase [Sulfitobacter sp. S74]MDF3463909.1 gamma-glutamyltransferase [Sulfitobacter sp. Ks18]
MWKVLSVLSVVLAGAAGAQQVADAVEPEAGGAGVFKGLPAQIATALASKDAGVPVVASEWMIAAANPHAVKAGADVLAAGGTAADALVAVQVVLGLVEPQSSGLGGGAFLVWYDAATGELTTLDGRETAPLAVTPRLFQDAAGEPLKFFDAVVGGRSVGTPGTPALLAEVHRRWGTQDWASLLVPAEALARDGFTVSPRLAKLVVGDAERLASSAVTAAYFMPQGVPVAAGDVLKNPAYAATLAAFAEDGDAAFYGGPIGRDIVATVQGAEGNPGVLAEVDLAIYQVKERPAVCAPYRGHEVCGMGPPSSGAVAVGQILGALEGVDLSAGPQDLTVRRLMGDAARLAFADRGRYLADDDYVPVPVTGLLDPAYLAERAKLLDTGMALEEVSAGEPKWDHALNWADDESIELPSTSHISIVDKAGNVASMTTTIENGFGSRLMVGGFLLNNELTDFSFRTHRDGVPIANRIEPGKRPRSSMAPTIVMKDGAPVMAVGSPGGSRIIGYVAQTIVAMIDWGMDVQQAVSVPHAVNRFGTYDLEEGTASVELTEGLTAMGFKVGTRGLTSGLHVIAMGDELQGGADPRREGIAFGQ